MIAATAAQDAKYIDGYIFCSNAANASPTTAKFAKIVSTQCAADFQRFLKFITNNNHFLAGCIDTRPARQSGQVYPLASCPG